MSDTTPLPLITKIVTNLHKIHFKMPNVNFGVIEVNKNNVGTMRFLSSKPLVT